MLRSLYKIVPDRTRIFFYGVLLGTPCCNTAPRGATPENITKWHATDSSRWSGAFLICLTCIGEIGTWGLLYGVLRMHEFLWSSFWTYSQVCWSLGGWHSVLFPPNQKIVASGCEASALQDSWRPVIFLLLYINKTINKTINNPVSPYCSPVLGVLFRFKSEWSWLKGQLSSSPVPGAWAYASGYGCWLSSFECTDWSTELEPQRTTGLWTLWWAWLALIWDVGTRLGSHQEDHLSLARRLDSLSRSRFDWDFVVPRAGPLEPGTIPPWHFVERLKIFTRYFLVSPCCQLAGREVKMHRSRRQKKGTFKASALIHAEHIRVLGHSYVTFLYTSYMVLYTSKMQAIKAVACTKQSWCKMQFCSSLCRLQHYIIKQG